MPTTAVTVTTDATLVSAEQLELVRRTVAVGATPDELALYLFDCKRQGVHPLDKLYHFTKRSGKYTPVTSIDFMRMRAAETGEMAGNDDPIFEPARRASVRGHRHGLSAHAGAAVCLHRDGALE